ncbi:glucosaminidase domain-containing protein [Lysinibacillus sp. KU-BSD001]|uniref:N-acetylglucosaminidase n=1 Tax=Lysinibacillus sp. KU-BSD001 TaxID=3141328 RepID=UPI0036F0CC32
MLFFIFAPLMIAHAADFSHVDTKVSSDKTWTITFNESVLESSISKDSIYVLDKNNRKQDTSLSVKGNVVLVQAPAQGYVPGESYTLHITDSVKSQKSNKRLNKSVIKPFTIAEGYAVVDIQADGTYSPIATYASFEEANGHLQKQQAIVYNNKYVKIPAGFVATSPKKVTLIYKQATFTAGFQYAGVAADTELLYVDATADYVKVHVAGQDMYVKHEDVTLIPTAAAKGQSYYSADDKGLWHRIYHHHAGTYDSSYLIGDKPAFLQRNVKYYSTDGANFVDANGQVVGESYAYFQYISPRVPTSYSAEQLNAFIAKELQAREQSGNKLYANATTKSPLQNMGALLKEMEKQYRINALLILSTAIHESNYGMSCHAQNYNNLFGLKVTDTNSACSTNVDKTSSKYFPSIEKNVQALVESLNQYYLDPLNMGDWRYNGVALGNKMIGMNVRYASDPYWGSKIAGHMYRADQALGGKDYKKYRLGFTSTANVSVRTAPLVTTGAQDNRAYQYKLDWTIKRLDHMPITLSNTSSEKVDWLRVISERATDITDLYTVSENVRHVTVY